MTSTTTLEFCADMGPVYFHATPKQMEELAKYPYFQKNFEKKKYNFTLFDPYIARDLVEMLADGHTDVFIEPKSDMSKNFPKWLYTLRMYDFRKTIGLDMDIQYLYNIVLPQDTEGQQYLFEEFCFMVAKHHTMDDTKIIEKIATMVPANFDLNELHHSFYFTIMIMCDAETDAETQQQTKLDIERITEALKRCSQLVKTQLEKTNKAI